MSARGPDIRRRDRVRVDPEMLAVLDAEIERTAKRLLPLRLQRTQVLRLLLARAVECQCGAPLGDKRAPPAATGDRQLEADDFVASVVSLQRQKFAREPPCVRLSRRQMLRVLVFKGARCACPTAAGRGE